MHEASVAISIIAGIGFGVTLLLCAMLSDIHSFKFGDEFRKYYKYTLIPFIIAFSVYMVIPSREDAIMIVAGATVIDASQDIKSKAKKISDLLDVKLDKIIESAKKEKDR